ncbi:hypothetical protein HAX54_014033 [Datura stramonium]|uniref:FAS1 domain-containing protein n=1 Tax=Datura stramonium TaxID=4076 RepID=A0ABS8TQ61_DATST|nr:hypothetical protein [Datura stramonium]
MHSKSAKNYSNSSHQFNRHALAINASKALRNHGFNILATLLQISPEIFLSTPQSTIFAIQDSAISNLSVPSWAMKQLLLYHTSPSKIPFHQLLKKPQGSCLTTLYSQKKIAITRIDEKRSSIEIDNVSVSHPDVFLEGSLSIHGVKVGLFTLRFSWNGRTPGPPRDMFPLQLNCILFLMGFLNSVNLSSVTIFAPPNLGFLSSPSPLLERIVRLHIVPQRYTSMELAFLPDISSLKTLAPGLNVTISKDNFRAF